MYMATEKLTVSVQRGSIRKLDQWVREGRYANRSQATQAVLDARALYVKRLNETVQTYGSPPYMQTRVDPRTSDRQVAMTTPEELAQLPTEDVPLVVGDGAVRYRTVLCGLGRIPPDASPLHRVTFRCSRRPVAMKR